MIELGMIDDYEKAEIIEGELIQKMTIGDKHASVVNSLNRLFVKNVSDNVLVSVQNPLRISDYNEPEPDFVLADLTKYDGKRHPRPAEVLFVVEVSDTTLKYDRDVKLPLYAEAEIGEVWIVNLPSEIVEVHTKPKFGLYQLVKIYNRGEILRSDAIPTLEIEVEKIIGE
ncbi:MAG: Uma2 family endonuclease [Acidobacteria bacterium]|nr:Uma2 family endonuclease [Acidobacteriota bacterium]